MLLSTEVQYVCIYFMLIEITGIIIHIFVYAARENNLLRLQFRKPDIILPISINIKLLHTYKYIEKHFFYFIIIIIKK